MYNFSWLDLTPYLLIAIVLILIVINKGNPDKKARTCFIIMFFFAAIRYGIGYDYYGYMKIVLHQTEEYSLERFEPFSRALVEIGHNTHYQFFFILASFITLYLVYRACLKLSINPAFSLLIYFLFPNYYLESFSIVRNAIAYSCVLYAFVMLMEKRIMWSVFMTICGILFHKSAAIGFLIYPLYYFDIKFIVQLVIFIISFVLSNLMMTMVGEYSQIIPYLDIVEHYADTARSEGGTMTFIVNGLCIFNFFVWNNMVKPNRLNGKLLTFVNIGGCLWNIFLPVDSTLALRFSSFFLIFIIFIVPQYKCLCHKRVKAFVNYCSMCFFVVLYLSYFIINANAYLNKPERMSNLPYQTIFLHKDYTNYLY